MNKEEIIIKKRIKPETLSIVLVSLIFVFSILISIGYSAINASLMVSGDLEYEARILYRLIESNSKGLDSNIDFSEAPTEATSGVYKMSSTNSDSYPVYYYRGIVNNNNVKFAGFCWKMVRTTETGGVKLIYNGVLTGDKSCNNTGESSQIGTSVFNSAYNDAKYVGYTYDTNTGSTIKAYIDDWYSKNLLSYTGMLEDTEWCNDRIEQVFWESGNWIEYGAYIRNNRQNKPSIICQNASDKYTVSSSKGNGLLKYPVALLTADELTLAGHGSNGYTSSGYLNTGQSWWTMSPAQFDENSFPIEYGMRDKGYINGFLVSFSGIGDVVSPAGVRPAISLKLGTMVSEGDGTVSNPYQIP